MDIFTIMTGKTVRRFVTLIISIAIVVWIVSFVRRSIPYNNSDKILSTTISIDSIWTLGPTVTIYDKQSGESYWIKSFTSLDHPNIDSLKSKKAYMRYMKFLQGPLENRVVRMEVDSVVIIDQVVRQE